MSELVNYPKAQIVYNVIAERSVFAAERFRENFLQTMFIGTSIDEIVVLNRFWRLQISRLPNKPIDVMECLDDQAEFNAWMNNFKFIVLPVIIQNKLPRHE